jgi:syntaxin 16
MSLKAMHPNRDTSDSSLFSKQAKLSDAPESDLEHYFQLAGGIKQDISDLRLRFDTLRKKHKECLRPTFTDTSDTIGEVETLAGQIIEKLQPLSNRINFMKYSYDAWPDRCEILESIRNSLLIPYREFLTDFNLEQQAFAASYGRAPHVRRSKGNRQGSIDFSAMDFGTAADQQRQIQLQHQRQDQEIEQIAKQAEEIRNIFADLAQLISDQGTVIDRIDFCISRSLDNARVAEDEVRGAAKYQVKSRMWICVLILLVLIGLLLFIALMK